MDVWFGCGLRDFGVNKMKIYNVGDSDILSEYDIQYIKNYPFKVVFYWYSGGGYDGYGSLIGVNHDNCWLYHDMGHCSCYGPCDDLIGEFPYKTLQELQDSCSSELLKQVQPVIDMAKKHELV